MYSKENEQKAIQYFKNNPNPDQAYCPRLIITYEGNNQKYGHYNNYYLPSTGQKFINNHPYQTLKLCKNSGWNLKSCERELLISPSFLTSAVYVKPVPGLDAIEISKIYVKNGRPDRKLNADIRKWEFTDFPETNSDSRWDSIYENDTTLYYLGKWYDKVAQTSRILLFKGDNTPYSIDGYYHQEEEGRYYNHAMVKYINSLSKYIITDFTASQLRTFFNGKSEYDESYTTRNFRGLYDLSEQYKHIQNRDTSEKAKAKTEMFDKIVNNIKVSIETIKNAYPVKYMQLEPSPWMPVNFRLERGFYYAEKDSDSNIILRHFTRTHNTEIQKTLPSTTDYKVEKLGPISDIMETSRVVITNKNEIRVYRIDSKGGFIKSSKDSYTTSGYVGGLIKNINVLTDEPRFKEFKDIFNNLNKNCVLDYNQTQSLLNTIKNPIKCYLYNQGYKNISEYLTCKSMADLKNLFQLKDITSSKEKQRNLSETLQVSKYQLEKFNEILKPVKSSYSMNHEMILEDFKWLVGQRDTRTVDKITTDIFLNQIQNLSTKYNSNWPSKITPAGRYCWRCGMGRDDYFNLDDKKIIQTILKMTYKDDELLSKWIFAIDKNSHLLPIYQIDIYLQPLNTKDDMLKIINMILTK